MNLTAYGKGTLWIRYLLHPEQGITYDEETNEECAESSKLGAEFIVAVIGELHRSSIDVEAQTFIRHIVDRQIS